MRRLARAVRRRLPGTSPAGPRVVVVDLAAPDPDAAVAAAAGDYLAFTRPGTVATEGSVPAMAAALAASGSDLVLGDARTPGTRSWAAELFGRPRTGADAGSCPLALVDLSLTTKLVGLGWWRDAGLRLGPGGVGEAAAALAALRAATAFDVLPRVVSETVDPHASRPVAEQPRFSAAEVTRRLDLLTRLVAVAPPGWPELAATHLLPPLYVDAVGGGEAYAAALAAGVGPLLAAADPARVPVAARVGGWVAQHGGWLDGALLQDHLVEHPHGLPVTAGLVTLPEGLTVEVPAEVRAVMAVDRRPRSWVADRTTVDGSGWTVRGASFTEYDDAEPLPDVDLVAGGRTIAAARVERRVDVRTNEWAARAFEDRSGCGWTATFERLPPGPGELRVGTATHPVRPLADASAATVVEQVALAGGGLTLRGSTDRASLTATARGPHGASETVTLEVDGGRFTGTLPLATTAFGERVRLPLGRYRLTLAAGRPVDAAWAPLLLADPPELVDDRQRVTLAAGSGGGPVLHVRAPLRADERGPFAQQSLRGRAADRGGVQAPYDRTVLLETFRGRSIGDNPGAIGRELLARDAGLDLAWVVDDPAVTVPEGTRAVVRRSAAWHELVAGARGYVSNAGAPYWFRKPPGQVHLQTWHGTPLKRIGEDAGPGDLATWRHRRHMAAQAAGWDAMLSPSRYCSEIFARAFRFDGTFWETGYPRNDVLLSPDADRLRDVVRQRLGVAAGERVLLYAPTWRSYLGDRDSKPLFLDAEAVTRRCPDVVVLVRGHYTGTRESEAYAGHPRVHDVTRYPDIADLYLAADVLVTDYSSVMFDFVLTDRPIVLLTPDLEQYREVERGFYVDLEEQRPGPMTRSTAEVVEVLQAPDGDAARRARFREAFCPLERGRSAADAVDRLLPLLG